MTIWIVLALSLLGWINFNFGSKSWFTGQLIRLGLGLATGFIMVFFVMPPVLPGFFWLLIIPSLVLNLVYTLVEATVANTLKGVRTIATLTILALVAVFVLSTLVPVFGANKLRDLAGAVTTDEPVAAIDVAHIRLVPIENADWKARKAIGNLGINFQVGDLSVQQVNGRLYWVAPLEFRGFWKWVAFKTSPGYILIDAEEPERPAEIKTGLNMRYLSSAYFMKDLKRHVYLKYGTYTLVEPSFELDDKFRPWIVYSLLRPSVGLSGERVQGVVIVNPETGEMNLHPMGEVPEWVDRVIPEVTSERYNTWFGRYVHGFWNSIFTERDVHIPTGWGGQSVDVFGVISNGRFYWFTGHTSPTTRDDSLVGYVMQDARTGQTTYYRSNTGLLNEAAAVSAVNSSVANFRGWHGSQPLFYNLYGAESWVIPVLSADEKFQGIGVVHARSGQTFFRPTKEEALAAYKQWLALGQESGIPSQHAEEKTLTGTVDRVSAVTSGGNTLFYFTVSGSDKIFTAHVGNSAKVPLTKTGDMVTIDFMDTSEKVVPVVRFDNINL